MKGFKIDMSKYFVMTQPQRHVNAMGGTKSSGCNQIVYDIWDWWVNKNSWLTATHIAGVENTKADKESRLFNDRTESTLKREIFAQIITH